MINKFPLISKCLIALKNNSIIILSCSLDIKHNEDLKVTSGKSYQ